MQRSKIRLERLKRGQRRKERGVALITTLLLLMLLTGLTLTMAWTARSDMLINGYYRNFRGSFYAADSGLNIMRQEMTDDFQPGAGFVPPAFAAGLPPIQATTNAQISNALMAKYGGSFRQVSGQGLAANSWPGKFKITSFSLTQVPCAPIVTCANSATNPTAYTYTYNYAIIAQGQAQGSETATLFDRGVITVNASLTSASSTKSFAAWGMFIDNSPICNGSVLVPGTISGPVFTNGAWNFGNTGKYTFTDTAGSASANAGYQAGNCQQVAGPSGNGISPTFQKGLNLNQSKIPLPTNDYNQERAVLDGRGTGGNAVSPSDLNSTVKNINKQPYPNSGAPTPGVYLPYTLDGKGNATFTGGGILVEGNASISLATTGATGQVYTITQGSTTTTITIDPATNSTVVQSGNTTLNISGVPTMIDPATGQSMGYDTMLYVDGAITGLQGPGQGVPAIQDGTALTITAAGNVTITGDILYKTPPVTVAANQIPGMPADSLIPGNDKGQALGIFTAKGDIQLKNAQANGNLEVDASLATISAGGTGGLTNVGSTINTLTIVGGRIQNNIKNIGTITRNVMFDQRFANGGGPPWFPSTTVSITGQNSSTITATVQRLQWQNQTAYF